MKPKQGKSLFQEWIQNFAVAISVMYALVLIPYSIMKGLFPTYLYVIFILSIFTYIIWWGIEHRIGKTTATI